MKSKKRTQYSVIHAPIVKYQVYMIQHREDEDALAKFREWNNGTEFRPGEVIHLGDRTDLLDGGLPTTLEATFDTKLDAEYSEEANTDT